MKIIALILYGLLQSAIAQELYSAKPNNSNLSILDTLETISPLLYTHIHKEQQFIDILGQTDYNVTFLLPNATALNASLATGALNFSQPTFNILSFLMLNGSFTTKSFLSKKRQFYTTLQPTLPPKPKISIGPLLVNFEPSTDTIELFSGLTKAQISANTEISCRNGIIHLMDHFLQPAQPALTTISIMEETEYMEGLLKSLNVSDVISGQNRTILAPISDAWKRAKGTSIPFGTLVHTLKYLVLDGLYTTNDIVSSMQKDSTLIKSDLEGALVNFTLNAEKKLVINSKAMIVTSDILTTTGIIHLIDDVFTPNDKETNSYSSSSDSTNTTRASVSPYASDNRKSNAFAITAMIPFYSCIFLIYLFI